MMNALKNPYYRTHQDVLPVGNPLVELKENELLQAGALSTFDWALTGFACLFVSYQLGDRGYVCTLSVECQKSCSRLPV